MAAVELGTSDSMNELCQLFDEGLKIHDELEDTPHPSNSKEFQEKVKKAIGFLEDATKLVNEIGLFSSNESIEEVATADIKYLLLPALLGSLSGKLITDDRLEVIEVSEIYFRDLLQRCKDYGLTDVSIPDLRNNQENRFSSSGPARQLDVACRQRQEKIAQYKKKKELERRLAELKSAAEHTNADEEIVREFYLVSIEKWISVALEELANITMEKPLLHHMQKVKTNKSEDDIATEKSTSQKRLTPIIITKNEIQKKVFGLGYPSIPAMTIDEFYEERLAKQNGPILPQMSSLQRAAQNPELAAEEKEIEDELEENKIERDDPEYLQHKRDWDDWKDENPRGSGNRKNMG